MKRIKPYIFIGNCAVLDGDSIQAMRRAGHQVTYTEMLHNCRGMLEITKSIGYTIFGQGLKIKDDFQVCFFKSKYQAKDCYYFYWSGYEYVFVKEL